MNSKQDDGSEINSGNRCLRTALAFDASTFLMGACACGESTFTPWHIPGSTISST